MIRSMADAPNRIYAMWLFVMRPVHAAKTRIVLSIITLAKAYVCVGKVSHAMLLPVNVSTSTNVV